MTAIYKFAFLVPVLFASQVAVAQSNKLIGIDAERNLAELGNSKNSNSAVVRVYDDRYEGVRGTPFFNENWAKARITANNTLYENVDVKYNVYEGELLYRNTKGQEFTLTSSKVDAFVLRDTLMRQEYTFRKFPALASQDPTLANRFVVALYEGKEVQLVMVPQKIFVKANFKGPYSSGNKYDELQDERSFFLLGPGNKATKVKLNKKNLLNALPDKRDKVEDFVSKEKIDAGTGAGWAKALAFYESI